MPGLVSHVRGYSVLHQSRRSRRVLHQAVLCQRDRSKCTTGNIGSGASFGRRERCQRPGSWM